MRYISRKRYLDIMHSAYESNAKRTCKHARLRLGRKHSYFKGSMPAVDYGPYRPIVVLKNCMFCNIERDHQPVDDMFR